MRVRVAVGRIVECDHDAVRGGQPEWLACVVGDSALLGEEARVLRVVSQRVVHEEDGGGICGGVFVGDRVSFEKRGREGVWLWLWSGVGGGGRGGGEKADRGGDEGRCLDRRRGGSKLCVDGDGGREEEGEEDGVCVGCLFLRRCCCFIWDVFPFRIGLLIVLQGMPIHIKSLYDEVGG